MRTYYFAPARYPAPARRTARGTRNKVIGLGAGAVVVAIAGTMALLGSDEPGGSTTVVWIAEKTTRAPGGMPDAVRQRLRELSDGEGGRLTAFAVGGRSQQVAETDLSVTVDGDEVADVDRRHTALDRRLDRVTAAVHQVPVGDSGFSLYEALKVGVDEAARTEARVEVWLSTTVLSGTTDPLSIPALTGSEMDPTQAVDELMTGSLRNLDMSAVDLNLVLLTPVGEAQQPLGPRAEHWRETFITALTSRLGATVGDPVPDASTAPAWRGSSAVPAIEPMVDRTPVAPPVPGDAAQPPQPPRIDNAAFHPDSAALVEPAAARAAVREIVAFQRANAAHYRIRVVGYCALFGEADGARRIARLRAEAIAGLLRQEEVPEADIDVHGKGHDERADPNQDPKSPAQRVVVISLIAR